MMRLNMSRAASGLLRSLISRSGAAGNRILLIDVSSTDWQSLTFNGERHRLHLRITGEDSGQVAARMCDGLADAEFNLPGAIVADIGLVGEPGCTSVGETELTIEALTIAED